MTTRRRASERDRDAAAGTTAGKEEIEDAEAKALMPPERILHSYGDVRRVVEGLGARTHDDDYPSGLTNGGNTCFASVGVAVFAKSDTVDGVVQRRGETSRRGKVCGDEKVLRRVRVLSALGAGAGVAGRAQHRTVDEGH